MVRALRLLILGSLLCASGLPAAALQAAAWTRMALRGDTRAECSVCLKAQDLARSSRQGISAAPSAQAELARPQSEPAAAAAAVRPFPLSAVAAVAPAAPSPDVTLPPPRARA